MGQAIDYDKLAREHGGTPVDTSAIDYDKLATEATTPPAAGPAQPPSGGLVGFAEEATPGINPVKWNEALQQMFWHPIDTAKGMVAAQDVPRQEAMSAFQQGDYLTGSRKLIDWLIPVIGPRLDEAADYMQQGQYARGLGATTDVGLMIATPKVVGKVVENLPTRAGVASTLERAGANRLARIMTPQVGPQKIRFGTMAAEVAPEVARRTTARTVSGLLDEVSENVARSTQKLDAAYAAVPAGTLEATNPIVAALERAYKKLTVPGYANNPRIEPAARAGRLASLKQALAEARALGPTASIEDLRKLRIAWDDGAQAVFTPITADNFQAARAAGHGWADARTALNEVMVQRHPELGSLNADVSLWVKAQDVLQAAEEVERVRPRVGRTLLSSAIGAGVAAQTGGAWAASLGALMGPAIERTIAAAAPAVKLTAARGMVQLADALRAGQAAAANKALLQISVALPAAQRAAFLAQGTRLLRDLQPAAATREEAPGAAPAGGPR